MAKKTLIIVESPNKIPTLKSILADNFEVKASLGHVIDLPKNSLGIDIDNGFEPKYVIDYDKRKIIASLKKHSQQAETVFLAPDPDREGEAISWHLARLLNIDPDSPCRITFNAITSRAVLKALEAPRSIDLKLVDSQVSRRIMDRLVGYKLSPLLWKKIRVGLSAGRVQSVALKLLCDREMEIKSFKVRKFWNIKVELFKPEEPGIRFTARLVDIHGKTIDLENESEGKKILEQIASGVFRVTGVNKTNVSQSPPLPFVTSTLQQEAFRRLKFSVKKTMFVAQKLYEGVKIGDRGQIGLITYIRTDSHRIEDEAFEMAKSYIEKKFGKEYVPTVKRQPKKKGKVQDAHEAIRPTFVDLEPEKIKTFLDPAQYNLYRLIYDRFIISQMKPADILQIKANIKSGEHNFLATGSEVLFPGFLIYSSREKEGILVESKLPELKLQEKLFLAGEPELQRNETQPPGRYTEGSLVKELEKQGIGRPSTYATIISTLKSRKYMVSKKRRLVPTFLGFIVNSCLVTHFPDIVNLKFTAAMEEKLDQIEAGQKSRQETISDFYVPFSRLLNDADRKMTKVDIISDLECTKCGKPMVLKFGKPNNFLACSGYPKCKNIVNISQALDLLECLTVDKGSFYLELKDKLKKTENESEAETSEPETGETCSKCGLPMVVKTSRYNKKFLACSGFPKCRNTKSLQKDYINASSCPLCNGKLLIKYTRRRRKFISCENYPECKYSTWKIPQ